jgi:hypothetical protein
MQRKVSLSLITISVHDYAFPSINMHRKETLSSANPCIAAVM